MAKEVPGLPSDDRHQMWLTLDEMLHWQPQSDVAKPYPAAAASAAPSPAHSAPTAPARGQGGSA